MRRPRVLPGLPACRALTQRIKNVLDDGVRFALLDRLPIDESGDEVAHAFYWILSSMIARPVQQKVTGAWIYPVHDTGRKATAGSEVRPDQTNMERFFHNNNSYNTAPPDYVALLCMQPAKSGGVSHVVNFYAVSNALVRAPARDCTALPAVLIRPSGRARARRLRHDVRSAIHVRREAGCEHGAFLDR